MTLSASVLLTSATPPPRMLANPALGAKARSQGWREPFEPIDELHHRGSLSPMLEQFADNVDDLGPGCGTSDLNVIDQLWQCGKLVHEADRPGDRVDDRHRRESFDCPLPDVRGRARLPSPPAAPRPSYPRHSDQGSDLSPAPCRPRRGHRPCANRSHRPSPAVACRSLTSHIAAAGPHLPDRRAQVSAPEIRSKVASLGGYCWNSTLGKSHKLGIALRHRSSGSGISISSAMLRIGRTNRCVPGT